LRGKPAAAAHAAGRPVPRRAAVQCGRSGARARRWLAGHCREMSPTIVLGRRHRMPAPSRAAGM